jgi:2,5-diketo-D-gluconate reductase A
VERGLSVIPRSTNADRIASNFAVTAGPVLTADEVAAISALGTGERCGPDPAHFE